MLTCSKCGCFYDNADLINGICEDCREAEHEEDFERSKSMNKAIKHAMIICVGNRSWNFPKHILMEADGKLGERLDNIAKRAFEKYRDSQTDKDIFLVSYTNYGDVEVFESNK